MLGSFYPGFMYGGASGWLGLVEMLAVNGMTTSVVFTSPTLAKTTALSNSNLSVATAIGSIALATGGMLLSMNNLLVAIDEDSVEMAALRSMGVEPISVMPIISAILAQIGYPVYYVGSDNIYAVGSVREVEYGIATINNNQIYEVVEQDAI